MIPNGSRIDRDFFSIKYLIKTALPPLPGSVAQISQKLNDDRASQTSIASALSVDPVLSSRVLRLANSPIYAMQGEVVSLSNAVSAIGNNAISDILMMTVVNDGFGKKILSTTAGRKIWRHSLATGLLAAEICGLSGVQTKDDAFICGLLHDIGQLILLRADMPLYNDVMQIATVEKHLTDVEREIFGFDHAELGAAAVMTWALPEVVSDVIRSHHTPVRSASAIALAHVIHIADDYVDLKEADADASMLLSCEAAMNLGLNAATMDDVWERVALQVREVLDSFGQ